MPEETATEGSTSGPWDRLLGAEGGVPVVVTTGASSTPNGTDKAKASDSGFLSSFQRSFKLSVGGKDPQHVFSRYRQSRFSARRIRKRVVFKHGDCNVTQANVAKRRRRYLQDIFTTLVDAQWRWTLLVFALNFLLSWLGFAIVWWLIVFTHGDLNDDHLSGNSTWTPCVTEIYGFASCFLFSVETQHTIGYGVRSTTEECPEAIFVMCLQSITGVFIQAFMVGIVFAKLSRPKKRTQTLMFSRNAVICQRDGQPCLMFRVGDMRKSHIIEAHVRAQLIRNKVTREGEHLPFFQQELKVGGDGEEDRIFFIWPTTIVHKIDECSPIYRMSATDLLRERFEIVVILEGVIESTGMTTQARSSYLPSEILWGHRFEPLMSFKKESGEYEVDYALFNNTREVDTPLCSAKQLDEHRAALRISGVADGNDLAPDSVDRLTTGLFPTIRSHSSDTLDLCSMDSLSLDDHLDVRATPSPTPPVAVTVTAPEGSAVKNCVRKVTQKVTPDDIGVGDKRATIVKFSRNMLSPGTDDSTSITVAATSITSTPSRSTTPVLARPPPALQKLFFRPGSGPSSDQEATPTEETVTMMGTDSPLIVITPKHTITAGMSRVSTYNSFVGQAFNRQDSTRAGFDRFSGDSFPLTNIYGPESIPNYL